MRSRFAVGKSGSRVHQATAVMAQLVRIGIQQHDQSVTLLHGCTQAFFQAAFVGSRDNHFIDHHFDAVHLVAVQLHAVEYLLDLAIDTDGQIAFLTNLLEQFLIMSLTIADQRSQEVCLLSLIMLQNQVEHLLFGVFHHLLSAQIRVRLSRPRIKQTEKVVDLCRRTDGRTGIFVSRFLFDRDDRAQSGDLIHIRTFHISEEVTGIGRECLHIPALSFRKNRIKSQ